MYDEIISSELLEAKTESILKINADTDALIKEVIGERANEYEIAEKEAATFKAAGYPSTDVPSSVSSDAIANGRTNQEACDLIITMSTDWRTMQAALRANRLLVKAKVKNATDIAELAIIELDWRKALAELKR